MTIKEKILNEFISNKKDIEKVIAFLNHLLNNDNISKTDEEIGIVKNQIKEANEMLLDIEKEINSLQSNINHT